VIATPRFTHLCEAVSSRDLVEIAILALAILGLLRFLGKTRGAGMVRGLGLLVVGFFLLAQVIITSFDLTVLGRVLDYLLTTVLVGLLVIFQPELRRGLMVLGQYHFFRYITGDTQHPIADRLADAAASMSRECVGALIAIERETALSAFVESGERIDAEVSSLLLRAIFSKRSPLHDGAVILVGGRLVAAGCQLPLGPPPEGSTEHMGMRHRSALSTCEETDAVLLVVSEETGRISIGVGGRLEAVPRDNLSRRLAALLSQPTNGAGGSRRPRRMAA
jgi:diadenylate cyclase